MPRDDGPSKQQFGTSTYQGYGYRFNFEAAWVGNIDIHLDKRKDKNNHKLSPVAIKVMVLLADLSKNRGYAFMRVEVLAERVGKDERSVTRATHQLKELGYIKIDSTTNVNRYYCEWFRYRQ